MGRKLDLEGTWPELFDGLDYNQRQAVVQSCAADWHAGWKPNYDDVKDLCDYARGTINGDEYMARGMARIDRRYHVPAGA